MRAPILAFLLLGLSFHASEAAVPAAKPLVTAAVGGFIRPAYHSFHEATGALAGRLSGLCAGPSQAGLDAARGAFAATVGAWSRVEIIRFGPVTEQNRLERVLFWPDRKGTGLKQVQAALAGEDASAADAATLPGKSVAMQGLGALEFVLHGTGAEALASGSAYRCAYGAAIAANLDTIAGELEAAWAAPDGFASVWANPGPDNPLYRDDSEAVGELLDVFIAGTELVRDVRLNGFFGSRPEDDKPRQALFWRSGLTVAALRGNLAGMRALFDASGIGAALPEADRWVAQSIDAQFANADPQMAAADAPLADVLSDPARRQKLDYFHTLTSSLSQLFGVRISGAFGITAGFSSLDGD